MNTLMIYPRTACMLASRENIATVTRVNRMVHHLWRKSPTDHYKIKAQALVMTDPVMLS
jgi:hypothetical protein